MSVAVIGIGEDGWQGLSPAAKQALSGAEIIFGGARHSGFLPPELQAKARLWQKPFLSNEAELKRLHHEGAEIAALASGDPMFFGAGATLSRWFAAPALKIYPHSSSFSYAAARLHWALQNVDCISVHGRAIAGALRYVEDKARLLILAHDGASAAELAVLLRARGFGKTELTVLEHLGGAAERRFSFSAAGLARRKQRFAELNIIAADCIADSAADNLPLYSALPDSAFIHDGQLTKQPVRAAVLAALSPKRGELLWDIGSGSGAMAIEWLRLARAARAAAVESHAGRFANIAANAARLGVPQLQAALGKAAEIIPDLLKSGAPDAVFIGGGVSDFALLEQCFAALKSGGRLAANAVTLEGEAALARFAAQYGGKRARFAVQNEEELGTKHILRPALPIYFLLARKN